MASKLQVLLPMIWGNLQETIADAKKGTASTHGYSAFFKTNDNIKAVQDVYEAMAAGDPVDKTNGVLRGQGRNINPLKLADPGFICIQEGDPSTAQAYSYCAAGTETHYMIASVGAQ